MELLSYGQFSDRFPLDCVESGEAWAKLLRKWRDDGKLIERNHWKHARVNGELVRVYNSNKVIRLIITEARGYNSRPRISYLYQNYLEEFVQMLENDTAPTSPTSVTSHKQDIPTK